MPTPSPIVSKKWSHDHSTKTRALSDSRENKKRPAMTIQITRKANRLKTSPAPMATSIKAIDLRIFVVTRLSVRIEGRSQYWLEEN